ncbi:MAG: protein kinase [Gemmatimonadaceae bacterium]
MKTPHDPTTALAAHYRIERELGMGGMATVYLAEDLKHKRHVAVKVLKPELAAVLGAERFVQEITTTAALQHPHILPLFDSGEADGFLYYVMPFIDGETLRSKLDRETQLGIEESVRIATAVADALDYAHRHGVIHRDIKPENILLHEGRPMVADFGIALALSAAAGGRMTETGLSLGTPHYMSPEQATAEKEISARSDVYSLASVLYEMLTGNPPHTGASAQQIIMKIITETAPLVNTVRKSVPANVAAAIAKALEKLPADRFDSASAFARALGDTHFVSRATSAAESARTRYVSHRAIPTMLAVALALMTAVAAWGFLRPSVPAPAARYALAFAEDQAPDPDGFALATSDGSRLIYRGPSTSMGLTQLWVKKRDELAATALPGTEVPSAAALSADDAWLLYTQGVFLRKVPIAGGTPTLVAENASNLPGSVTWLADGSMVYVTNDATKLMRVPGKVGPGKVVWSSDSLILRSVTPFPDGQRVMLSACRRPCDKSDVYAVDLETATGQLVIPGATYARYLEAGQVVYVTRENTVLVAPFDARSLTLRGTPVVMMDSVVSMASTPFFTVSSGGTLVMRRGVAVEQQRYELVWVDRAGHETQVDSNFTFRLTAFAGNFGWSLSPDGTHLAIGMNTSSGDDIWTKTLPRGPVSRVTSGPRPATRPRWTADGRSILAVSDGAIILHHADGTGPDSVLWRGHADEALLSPDGKWLVIRMGAKTAVTGGRDVYGLRLGGDTTLTPLLNAPYDEYAMALSPDGKWLAYESNETGREEVFVRPFPNTNDGKVPVSSNGGASPLWSRDGRELFFVRGHNAMMSASITPGATIRVGEPHVLFESGTLAERGVSWYTPWDVAPDGRFMLVRSVHAKGKVSTPLTIMENWLDDANARVRR